MPNNFEPEFLIRKFHQIHKFSFSIISFPLPNSLEMIAEIDTDSSGTVDFDGEYNFI